MTSSRFSPSFGPRESEQAKREPAAFDHRPVIHGDSVAEVILSTDSGKRTGLCERTCPAVRPCGVFVPENYEPNYAYPLVVWLHETGRSERDILRVLPQISMRNYLGLALRGTAPAASAAGGFTRGYGWSLSERSRLAFQEEFKSSVRRMRQDFHVHSERVFLVGAGDGGTLAWDFFLSQPEWFAGVAVLGGRFPWQRRPLRRYRELRGRHAFVAADGQDPAGICQAQRVERLLYSAGLEVSVRCHLPGLRRPRALLRQLDYWIMQSIGGCL